MGILEGLEKVGLIERTGEKPPDKGVPVRPPGVTPVARPTGVAPAGKIVPRVARVPVPGGAATPATAPVEVDPEYFEQILQAIAQSANLPPGFDQLIQMIIAMEKQMPGTPLKARFEIALGTLGPSTGLDRKKVATALRDQQRAVANLRAQFDEDMKQSAEDQKAAHATRIKDLSDQIRRLTAELATIKGQLDAASQDQASEQRAMDTVDAQLAADNSAFKKTCDAVQEGIPGQQWIGIDNLLSIAEEEGGKVA